MKVSRYNWQEESTTHGTTLRPFQDLWSHPLMQKLKFYRYNLMHMKNYSLISTTPKFVLCDIDDTLTNEGELHGEAYQSLWDLTEAGMHIIPITGRPALGSVLWYV
jgi:hypothetical protein